MHGPCRQPIDSTSEQIVIPSPVLVEVDWLAAAYWPANAFLSLLEDIAEGRFELAELAATDILRAREVIDQYASSKIGFVDAAVLAIVERLNEPKLATLDQRHFAMMSPATSMF